MVFFNHATRQMTVKIVYYGPGLCGKTTNLNTIYGRTAQKARGEMVSLNTETDRTLFFDLLPMDVGVIGGFKTKLQLYTVPGQVFYNSTRKLVLKGVDGIVFVADSQDAMLDANRESHHNLRDNLRELGLELADLPLVFQWNKRDLKNIVPVEILERELQAQGKTAYQSIAQDGTGVFETLRGITRLALANIKAIYMGEAASLRPASQAPGLQPAEVDPAPLRASDVALSEALFPSAPPPGALANSDLPSFSDLFEECEAFEGLDETPLPASVHPLDDEKTAGGRVQVLTPPRGKVFPAGPALMLPRLPDPVLAPEPPIPWAPLPDVPALALELSSATVEGDLEIVVSIRQNGAEVGGGTLRLPAPAQGGSGAASLDLKRS